ncbi:hypothetical protein ACQ4M3_00890 [Leptolyngbya sp. AN03gr2]|uniref:hypothetical protein n=1 Tax=unclassified Leptolyngbya TaxID=2650499 RepID=UPI003D316070
METDFYYHGDYLHSINHQTMSALWVPFNQCATFEYHDDADAVAKAYGGVVVQNPLY